MPIQIRMLHVYSAACMPIQIRMLHVYSAALHETAVTCSTGLC
jgi:hypothetical protein